VLKKSSPDSFTRQSGTRLESLTPPSYTPSPLILDPDASFVHQVRVLTTFYSGKLDDTETIVPSLQGLMTLVTFPQFTSSDALEVTKAFVPAILPICVVKA